MSALIDMHAACSAAAAQFNSGQMQVALRMLPQEISRVSMPFATERERIDLQLTRARLYVDMVILDGDGTREALRHLNAAERQITRTDQTSAAALHLERGRLALIEQARFQHPDFTGAAAALRRAVEFARKGGESAGLAAALVEWGRLMFRLGMPEEAIDSARTALDLVQSQGRPDIEADVLHALGLLLRAWGDSKRALSHLNRALNLRQNDGLRVWTAVTHHALGESLLLAGLVGEAHMHLSASAELAERFGARRIWARAALGLADLHLRTERRSAAWASARTGRNLACQIRDEPLVARADRLLMQLGRAD